MQSQDNPTALRVELRQDGHQLVATYRLDPDGRAVHDGPVWLDGVAVIEPDPPVQVFPAEGERYLRALPAAFTGTRTRAVLIGGGR